MSSLRVDNLKDIPDPLTIGVSFKSGTIEQSGRESPILTCQDPGRHILALIAMYLFIYLLTKIPETYKLSLTMTTIPTRLARAATSSTSSVHQRKRVLDLYREWMRGVRLLSSLTLLPSCHFFLTSHRRHLKSAHYTPSTSRHLQCAPSFATALRRTAMRPTRS
jgi:hypothetical protein